VAFAMTTWRCCGGPAKNSSGTVCSFLRRASEELVGHGVQLRRDATAPFTRLIVSQSEALSQLRTELNEHQQALIAIQRGLAEMKLSHQASHGPQEDEQSS